MTDADTPSLVIERTFSAPIDQVWSMWATGENFASWYGPQGASIPTANMDVTVGGRRLICMEMQTPNGEMKMWFAGEYLEVDAPDRLVYTEAMSNEAGDMPDEGVTQVIIELSTVDEGTHMVMTHQGIPADSPGAMGWKMAIDKLVALLEG